jgi:hypothetical protein
MTSYSILILTTIYVKQCMNMAAGLYVCMEFFFLIFLMFVLTIADGLWCAWYTYPILCPEIGTSSVSWAQLSRFHLKMETESSF